MGSNLGGGMARGDVGWGSYRLSYRHHHVRETKKNPRQLLGRMRSSLPVPPGLVLQGYRQLALRPPLLPLTCPVLGKLSRDVKGAGFSRRGKNKTSESAAGSRRLSKEDLEVKEGPRAASNLDWLECQGFWNRAWKGAARRGAYRLCFAQLEKGTVCTHDVCDHPHHPVPERVTPKQNLISSQGLRTYCVPGTEPAAFTFRSSTS